MNSTKFASGLNSISTKGKVAISPLSFRATMTASSFTKGTNSSNTLGALKAALNSASVRSGVTPFPSYPPLRSFCMNGPFSLNNKASSALSIRWKGAVGILFAL